MSLIVKDSATGTAIQIPPTYHLHPLVVFNILDHFARRASSQERVIGTLLGKTNESNPRIIEVTNSFPIPHEENDDGTVAVNIDYHHTMFAHHQRVNPRELVIGWYSTGDESVLSDRSVLIHEVYREKLQMSHAIMLVVNTALSKNRLDLHAYTAQPMQMFGETILSKFEEVNLVTAALEPERIGVDALLSGIPESDDFNSPIFMMSDLDSLEQALLKLRSMIEKIAEHVSKVLAGDAPKNKTIGREIANALASMPQLDPATFRKMRNTHLQDLMMTLYLAELTRTQLTLGDKLQLLL